MRSPQSMAFQLLKKEEADLELRLSRVHVQSHPSRHLRSNPSSRGQKASWICCGRFFVNIPRVSALRR